MSIPRFELFSFWRTSATYRVRVALNLKGLVAEEHNIDVDAGENRSEEFLRVNPMGGLPALIDREGDKTPLTQSLAILEFLEDIAPTPSLLPGTPHDRARIRALAGMLASDTHPFITPRVKKYLTANAGFDPATFKAWQMHWLTTGLQAYEQRLVSDGKTGRFSHGDAVTMADVCLASIVVIVRVFGIKIDGVPTVDRIIAACEEMDAFAKADPMKQAGAPTVA